MNHNKEISDLYSNLNAKFRGSNDPPNHRNTTLPLLNLNQEKKNRLLDAIKETQQEAEIMRAIHFSNSSEKYLTRLGSSKYFRTRQMSRQQSQKKSSTKRIPSAKNNSSCLIKDINKCFRKQNTNSLLTKFRKQINTSKVVKKVNQDGIKENREVKTNIQSRINEIYTEQERPVYRIGANMQQQAKFQQHHITNIIKMNSFKENIMPIVYCIKDQEQKFVGSPIQRKNNQIPICLCLFAESLDSKEERTKVKRLQYLNKIKKNMNGSFDPQIMSKFTMIGDLSPFNIQAYQACLKRFTGELDPSILKKLEEMVIRLFLQSVRYDEPSLSVADFKAEIFEAYKVGNSIAKFDYFLKNKDNKKTMERSLKTSIYQYGLHQKHFISSNRIKYHGGYSKILYGQWHQFYAESTRKLSKKLLRYHDKIQSTNSWLQNFNEISLIQKNYFIALSGTTKLDNFQQIQQIRIKAVLEFIKQFWHQGLLSATQLSGHQCFQHWDIQTMQFWNLKLESLPEQEQLVRYQQLLQSSIQNSQNRIKTCSVGKQTDKKPIIEDLNKCKEILINIYYEDLISRGINSYIQLIVKCKKPLFSLDLIVDRQTLKLKEGQDKVIYTIVSVIQKILAYKFKIFGNQIIEGNPQTINHVLEAEGNYSSNASSRRAEDGSALFMEELKSFIIQYKYKQIHNKPIQRLIHFIRDNYKQAQHVIQYFSQFMPFIKLTAKDKLFVHENSCNSDGQWEVAEQIFTKNISSIEVYQQELQKIPVIVSKGIFQINCKQPIKLLTDRLKQIEYMSQQKYLSKVYQRIHEHEQEIAKIMTVSHCNNITTENMDQVLFKYDEFSEELKKVKIKMRDLGQRVYFYVEKRPKSQTLIARYQQLIHKREELIKSIKQLKNKAVYDCLILQKQFKDLNEQKINEIQQYEKKLNSLLKLYFDSSKIDVFVQKIELLKSDLEEFAKTITPELLKSLQSSADHLNNLLSKVEVLYENWSQIKNFYLNSRMLQLQSINEINVEQYQSLISIAQRTYKKFIQIFNVDEYQEHEVLLLKFKQDLSRYKGVIPYLKLLGKTQIPTEYFEEYNCQQFRKINFKKLLQIENIEEYYCRVAEMSTKALCENIICKQFRDIETSMKTLKIKIVDYNGNDSFDRVHAWQTVSQMSNFIFRCSDLLSKKYCENYQEKIIKLKTKISKCSQIMQSWLIIQREYFHLQEFYRNNDDSQNQQEFKKVSNIYKKVMKSFDIDDSVWFIPKNDYFLKSKLVISNTVQSLKNSLFVYFNQVKLSNPRLYTLTNQELLAVMSHIDNIPKYLPKCLPSINNISIKQDSIERVGGETVREKKKKSQQYAVGNYLVLAEPLQIGARLSQVAMWIQKLNGLIKDKLRSDYLHFNTIKSPCIQICALKMEVAFTAEMDNAMACLENKTEKLSLMQKNTIKKIEKYQKETSEKEQFATQLKILTLINQRDFIREFISEKYHKNSYRWFEIPKFYEVQPNEQEKNNSQVEIHVKIMHLTYLYGFKFIQHISTIQSTTSLYGNLIIGRQGTGKTSLIRHLAYLTGHQLFIYKAGTTSLLEIQNIIYFFKIAVFSGSWLVIPNIHYFFPEAINIVIECLRTVEHAVKEKSKEIKFFNCQPLKTQEGYNFFMTSVKLDENINKKLGYYLRPNWIAQPNTKFLYNLQLQCLNQAGAQHKYLANSDRMSPEITYKIIDYQYWLANHLEVPLEFANRARQSTKLSLNPYKNLQRNHLINNLLASKFIELGSHSYEQDQIDYYLKSVDFLVIYSNHLSPEQQIRLILPNVFLISYFNVSHWQALSYYINQRVRENHKFVVIRNGLQYHDIICTFNKRYSAKIKVIYLQDWQNIKLQTMLRYRHSLLTVQIGKANIQQNNQLLKFSERKQNKKKNNRKIKKNLTFKSTDEHAQYEEFQMLPELEEKWSQFIKFCNQHLDCQTLEKIGLIFKSLYEPMKRYFTETSVFVFLLSWVYGTYIHVAIMAQWLSKHNIISHTTNPRCIPLIPHKQDLCSQQDIQILSNIQRFRRVFPTKSFIVSNIDNIKEIRESLIINPKRCYHIYPPTISSIQNIKHLLDEINQDAHDYEQSSPHSNQKNVIQIVVHSAHHIQSSYPELFSVLLELAQKKQSLVYINNQIQCLAFKKDVSFIFEYESFTALQYKLSTEFFTVAINSLDVESLQVAQISTTFQSMKIVDFDYFQLYKDFNKILGDRQSKYFKSYWSNSKKKPELIQIQDQDIRILVSLCQLIQVAFSQYFQPKNNVIQFLSKFVLSENKDTVIKELTRCLELTSLQQKKRLCKGMMEVNSSFTLHLSVFNSVEILKKGLQFGHLTVFGLKQYSVPYLIQIVAALLGTKVNSYTQYMNEYIQDQEYEGKKKKILRINSGEISTKQLLHLESQVCDEKSLLNRNYTVVVQLSNEDDYQKSVFTKFSFLKSWFLRVTLAPIENSTINKIVDLQKSLKNLENNQDSLVFCKVNDWEINQSFSSGDFIASYFQDKLRKKPSFIIEFYERKKQIEDMESTKYKFYKNLTEQMFETISDLSYQIRQVPNEIQELKQQREQLLRSIQQLNLLIQEKNRDKQKLNDGMNLLVKLFKNKIQSNQDREVSVNRLKKQFSPAFDKIYDKIDALSPIEAAKFKIKSDNEVMASIKQFFYPLLTSKNKILPLKELRNIMQNNPQYVEVNREQIRKIHQQIKGETKGKIDKMGVVYRYLADWIGLCDSMESKIEDQIKKLEESRQKKRKSMQNLQMKIELEKTELINQENSLTILTQELMEMQHKYQIIEQRIELIQGSQQRIETVLNMLKERSYKGIISKHLAQWLYNIPKIIIRKTIKSLCLNEYESDTFFIEQLLIRLHPKSFDQNQDDEGNQINLQGFEYRELGLTHFSLDYNIFGDFQKLLDLSKNFKTLEQSSRNGSDNLEREHPEIQYEKLQILYEILNCQKQVQIIEDNQMQMRSLLTNIYQNQERSLVINLGPQNLNYLLNILPSKIGQYKQIFVIGPGLIHYQETQQFYQYINSFLMSQRRGQTNLLFLFQNIDIQYSISMFRFISQRKIKISLYHWVKVYGRIVRDQKFFSTEMKYRKNQTKMNIEMKNLFQKIEGLNVEKPQSYENVLKLFQEIEKSKQQYEESIELFKEEEKIFKETSRKAGPYYVLLHLCQQLESQYNTSLFESGTCIDNFVESLKKTKDMKEDGERLSKFSILLSLQLRFINIDHLTYYCMVVAFLLIKPKSLQSNDIIELILKLPKYPVDQQIQLILRIFNIDEDFTSIESLLDSKSANEALVYFTCAFTGNPASYTKQFWERIWKSFEFKTIEQIVKREKYGHYYEQILLPEQKSTLTFKKKFRHAWIVSTIEDHYNSCMEYLYMKTKKQSKEESQPIIMYYDDSKYNLFLNKIKGVSQTPTVVILMNLAAMQQGKIIDNLLYELNCNGNKIHQNFRLYIVVMNCLKIKLKEYTEYFQYKPILGGELEKGIKILPVDQKYIDQIANQLRIVVNEAQMNKLKQLDSELVQALPLNQSERASFMRKSIKIIKQEQQENKLSANRNLCSNTRPTQISQYRQIISLIDETTATELQMVIKAEIASIINQLLKQQIRPNNNKKWYVPASVLKQLIKGSKVLVDNYEIIKTIIYYGIQAHFRSKKQTNILKRMSEIGLAMICSFDSNQGFCINCRCVQNLCKIIKQYEKSKTVLKMLVIENSSGWELVPKTQIIQIMTEYDCFIRIQTDSPEMFPIQLQFIKKS